MDESSFKKKTCNSVDLRRFVYEELLNMPNEMCRVFINYLKRLTKMIKQKLYAMYIY